MKTRKIFPAIFFAACLCACGETVGADSDIAENQAAITSSGTTQTTLSTSATTSTTTTVTTALKISTNPPEDVNFAVYDSAEIYEDMTIAELIADTNVALFEPEKLIDTSELGEKTVNVIYNYEGKTYQQELPYTVVDTTEPTILNSGWNPYVKIGEAFNLDSIIGYADNYDSRPVATYEGVVDTSTVGAYPITVTVTDSSGNESVFYTTVFVMNNIPDPEDDNERVAFSDFVKKYSYFDNVSFGLDVSAWQTYVDYDKVKAEGVEFVLMRMGYCYSTIYMDDYYYNNMQKATDAGLDIGVYFYTTANTEEKAREQARWIVDVLDGRELDFPIAFDWENWENFQQYNMSLHELNEIYYAFNDELEKNGYSAMLYSSKNFLLSVWENRIDSPVWLAHYVNETDYTGDYNIWQASAYGRIPGIEGDVDMNIRFN